MMSSDWGTQHVGIHYTWNKIMTIEVARADLEQVAAALDNAVTAVDVNTDAALSALELVQTYLDGQDDDTGEATEVSDSETDGNDASADVEVALAEDDIPF